jgi:xanthine dehydrogenase accessory factor
MRAELLQLASELAGRGEPFVLAMVVRRESYSSAQQGDMAIITADGGYHGWLGGNCTQPVVRREAKHALADGKPRLVSLSPDPTRELRPGVSALPMACHSGGTVDIYLEPIRPPPRLLLFGASPVVRALGALGKAMGYSVDEVGAAAPAPPARSSAARESLYAVVATMGENDEDAVAAALEAQPGYLGVVASRKRFAELRQALLARGVAPAALETVRSPAGLDIGARRPEEVALSILSEIVKLRRAADDARAAPGPSEEPEAIDPVCGMTVVIATARHRGEHAGQTYYFCNPRCREKFLAAPARFLTASAG